MNRIKMKEVIKTFRVFLVVAIVACGLVLPQHASAAPVAPTWLPGQPLLAGSQVIAMWLPVPGAVKYIVYMNGGKIAESPANQYMGLAPEKSGKYEYRVVAVDASGTESPKSPAGFITIVKIEAPKTPIFRANAEEPSTLVRWVKPPGGVIFNVYRSPSKEGPWNLLTSTQEETYKDSEIKYDVKYFYTITAKNSAGKESDRSKILEVLVKTPEVARALPKYDLVPIGTEVERTVDIIGEALVGSISRVRQGGYGEYYLLNRTPVVLVVDKDLNFLRSFSIPKGEGMVAQPELYNITMVDDDSALICDLKNMMVHYVDMSKGSLIRSFTSRKPTLEEDPEIYESLPDRFKTDKLQPLAAAMLPDGRVIISDGNGSLIHILDEDGNIEKWIANYTDVEGTIKVMAAPTDLIPLEDGTVLAPLGIGRRVLRVDPDTFQAKYVIGQAESMVGMFVGYGGISLTPQGNILVSDPTFGTLQVFDMETGAYIAHLGASDAIADPNEAARARVDFNAAFWPFITEDNKLVFFLGYDKVFQVRDILAPIPEAKAPAAEG